MTPRILAGKWQGFGRILRLHGGTPRTSLSLTLTEASSVRSERLRLHSPREREQHSNIYRLFMEIESGVRVTLGF